ncbi:MAG: DUF6572 domain-containing protein [Pseudomonadota bacterium]
MSIEQPNKIDSITIDAATAICRLAIVDHLQWDLPHLEALQRKINYYLHWVESGEIYLQHPHAVDCEVSIDITAMFEPDAAAIAFIAHATELLDASGFRLTVSPLASHYAEASI